MLILQTKRLILRHLEPSDLPALDAIYREPEVQRFIPDGPRTLDETKAELEWHRHGHPRNRDLGLWATVERSSGRLVGRCGLLPWTIDGSDEVELAFLIAKDRWGEGLATEAATGIVAFARERLRLNRLICLISHGNDASVRIAEKLGMVFERDYRDEHGPCMIYGRSLRTTA
jgi:RimJ/RimL family protein N-acetyltransferase